MPGKSGQKVLIYSAAMSASESSPAPPSAAEAVPDSAPPPPGSVSPPPAVGEVVEVSVPAAEVADGGSDGGSDCGGAAAPPADPLSLPFDAVVLGTGTAEAIIAG